MIHLPTNFSKTEDFPLDCIPTTAICGKSMSMWTFSFLKVSWSLFIGKIIRLIPLFSAISWKFLSQKITKYSELELSRQCTALTATDLSKITLLTKREREYTQRTNGREKERMSKKCGNIPHLSHIQHMTVTQCCVYLQSCCCITHLIAAVCLWRCK